MKKFVWILIVFSLGLIFLNSFGVNKVNINKRVNGIDKPTFTFPNEYLKKYNPQSILVKFKAGITRIQKDSVIELVGGTFKDKNKDGIDDRYKNILGGRLVLLELKGNRRQDQAAIAIRTLKENPIVEYAEYNHKAFANVIPVDPLFNTQWGMHNTGQTGGVPDADIDAPEAWDISTGSSDVIVGVVDTGVDYYHEDLAENIWLNPNEIPNNNVDDDGNGYIDDIHGINAILDNGDPLDDNSHGTHVSGIIGAIGNNNKGVAGVNWSVKIIGMKFLDEYGSGWISDAVECYDYAVGLKRRGINLRALNNSWRTGSYTQSLADAINEATNEGILSTAAASNEGSDNDIYPIYPANHDTVLAVASTDKNDNLSFFSNYGSTTVDLGAPGSEVMSTVINNGYESLNGTSMATPHVTGAAALILSINDQLTVQEVKDYLMNYGDPLSSLNGKTVSGKRLNVYNSLKEVPPSGPTFRLSVSPVFHEVEQGQSVSFTINIESVLDFSQPVYFKASAKPDLDGSIVFTPNPGTPGSNTVMTVHTTNTTELTDYIINIEATSGSITRTITVLLKVTPPGMVTLNYSNNTVKKIPDGNSKGITSIINVPDALKIWEIGVTVNITHPYIGDLVITLISPSGTEVVLHNMEGGYSENLHRTYYPKEFRDESSRGDWKLVVADVWSYFEGTLDSWSLSISGIPENPLPPQANFYAFPTVVSIGRSVTFTDISANYPSSRLWIFEGGDPPTSTLPQPRVTYSALGKYDVTLMVSNPQGKDTLTKPDYITVVAYQPPPVANFTASETWITEGTQITFNDTSTKGPTMWFWTFPGGSPASSREQNPKVTYNTLGVYDVILTVNNPGGIDTKIKRGYIHVSKIAKKLGQFDFSSPNDRALVFDYNGDDNKDLFFYRPGSGVASVVRSNGDGTFDNVYYADGVSSYGIGLYDLRSINDLALRFDYNGDGNDDLFIYRPGSGAVGVIRSNGDGTFTSVYNVIDNGSDPPNGIGGFTLLSSKDRALTFKLDGDIYEDLVLYRPSRGAITALTSRGDGTFKTYYTVPDNGADPPNGIGWFDLLSSNDKALRMRLNWTEALLFYRPGRGAISIFDSSWDGTFRNVYTVIDNGAAYPNGIGGYDLLSTKDKVLTFDFNGDLYDDLLLFRPGKGAIGIIRTNDDETFSSVYKVIDNGSEPPNGIAGYDLLSPNDSAVIFDYNGDSFEDIFFYRPGRGAANIVISNGDGTFKSVYSVIDNGSNPPNGIGGYNLLSSNDRVLAYDYNGDNTYGLFFYRPGGQLMGIVPAQSENVIR